jgi:glycosyltransferase involved in cell wall biosynthesis
MTDPPKTRIAVVVSQLAIGGAEQLLLELLRHIDAQRFDMHIFFLREPGAMGTELLQLGVPVTTRIIRFKWDMRGVFALAGLLENFQADVVLLLNHLNTLFFGVLAARIAGVKVCINWVHETFRRYPFHWMTMLGRRMLHLGVDYVVAVAKGHGDYIAIHEHIPRAKIRVIYNGVDPSRFQSSLGAEQARVLLGIPPRSPVVSILAALRPDKAHHVFLHAAAVIVKTIPQTHFLVIGDGPRMPYLKSLAKDLNIEKQVHFLGFRRHLGDILAAVDINCLSSYPQQETLSVAAIEAMSAGIPIVCTDVGFMHEIVIPNETGFLVPVDDAGRLAEKIMYILMHPELKEYMRHQCRQIVNDILSVHRMVECFEDLFIDATDRTDN